MKYKIQYLPKAIKDMYRLDESVQRRVVKAIDKVSFNPLSIYEGGYGKPLGNKSNADLTGLYRIKLKRDGIRIVYKLMKTDKTMIIIVVEVRKDDEVYKETSKRIE